MIRYRLCINPILGMVKTESKMPEQTGITIFNNQQNDINSQRKSPPALKIHKNRHSFGQYGRMQQSPFQQQYRSLPQYQGHSQDDQDFYGFNSQSDRVSSMPLDWTDRNYLTVPVVPTVSPTISPESRSSSYHSLQNSYLPVHQLFSQQSITPTSSPQLQQSQQQLGRFTIQPIGSPHVISGTQSLPISPQVSFCEI